MSRRGVTTIFTVVMLAGGCAYVGSSSASPDASSQATADATLEPAASASASSDPTQEPTLTPTADPTIHDTPDPFPTPTVEPTPAATATPFATPDYAEGRAASDQWWEQWFETCWFGAFEITNSLAQLTRDSDLVIRGTITDLQTRDRNDSGFRDAHIDVLITEVLQGEPVSEEAGTVEVVIGHGYDLEGSRSNLPSHDHLWFLKEADDVTGAYYTTDFEQISVFRDIDGVVRVIRPEYTKRMYDARQFPVPLEGTSYVDLLDRVRDLVRHGAAPGAMRRLSSLAC